MSGIQTLCLQLPVNNMCEAVGEGVVMILKYED